MSIKPRGLYGRAGFELDLRELPRRALLPHEVRLGVLACGLCGTDLHFLRQMKDFTPMGHEVCAKVIEVGDAVTRFAPGQQVVMEDVAMCGMCDPCKSGRVDLCRDGYTMQDQPGMADELVAHERMLHLAEGIDPVTASMSEPLAVAIRCVETLSPPPGKPLAVFGMGAIGLFCAAYARLRGAGPITMIARDSSSLRNQAAEKAALALGAHRVLYTQDTGWKEQAGLFDALILAAPPSLAPEALGITAYGGKVLAAGVTFGEDHSVLIDINDMVFNKKSLLSSIAEPGLHFPLALSLIASGQIEVSQVITHRLPLAEAEGIETLYNQDAPAVKTVILPG